MNSYLTAGFVVCATALPVFADKAACVADLEATNPVLDGALAELAPAFEEGRCVLRDLELALPGSGPEQVLHVEAISWKAEWADRAEDLIPQALGLDVRDAWLSTQVNDFEELAYQIRLVSELNSTDLLLDYTLDPETGRFDLNNLDVRETSGNRLTVSAQLGNFDFSALTARPLQADRLMQIRLDDLDLKWRNTGFFEGMAQLWLPLVYPRFGDTPELAVGNTKIWLRDQINKLPGSLVITDSRDTLAAMVDTLPHPEGAMHLRLTTENGLAPQDIAAVFLTGAPIWDRLEDVLGGVSIAADWQQPEDCGCDDTW
ncbi:hypothetical protein [Paracoccus saliphilus]|uniref:DUF2125 domain-containing protein n=1 Tax=Paracoccus saliphilus TaxID=405559 RepID=A0AA45W2T4_9RHOB|nr:hypothetical protein [Paracoccus saliphilus]WCR05070.1 hypothetical protein JHX88_10405 [Paracoccus saliphilus]SIS70486.1 hypothetical protein SAMN05421772_103122 [Paracoccus saliphilus]